MYVSNFVQFEHCTSLAFLLQSILTLRERQVYLNRIFHDRWNNNTVQANHNELNLWETYIRFLLLSKIIMHILSATLQILKSSLNKTLIL